MIDPKLRATVDAITKKLTDEGRIIEAGWKSYQLLVIPPNAPQVQFDESRNAFFAGAQHLWGSIFSMLDADAEPTDADLERFGHIEKEMRAFYEAFKKKHGQ